MRIRALSALLGALLFGCDDPPQARESPSPKVDLSAAQAANDPASRAVLILDRDTVAVGEPFEVVLVVETPAEYIVEPPAAPETASLELLGVRSRVDARPGLRLLHTSSQRLRANAPGALAWPASRVVVEAPTGERTSLSLPARQLEITSARALFPRDQVPFGLRDLPDPAESPGFLRELILASGAVLGLVLFFRRRGRRLRERARSSDPHDDNRAGPEAVHEQSGPAWTRAELTRARALLGEDPRAASNIGAAALRAHVARRFRIQIESATTEELAFLRPGAASKAVWSEFLRIMQGYDAERFQRRDAGEPWTLQVGRCLEESERFLADAAGPGEAPR